MHSSHKWHVLLVLCFLFVLTTAVVTVEMQYVKAALEGRLTTASR